MYKTIGAYAVPAGRAGGELSVFFLFYHEIFLIIPAKRWYTIDKYWQCCALRHIACNKENRREIPFKHHQLSHLLGFWRQ